MASCVCRAGRILATLQAVGNPRGRKKQCAPFSMGVVRRLQALSEECVTLMSVVPFLVQIRGGSHITFSRHVFWGDSSAAGAAHRRDPIATVRCGRRWS
jgi:hypothetical protein